MIKITFFQPPPHEQKSAKGQQENPEVEPQLKNCVSPKRNETLATQAQQNKFPCHAQTKTRERQTKSCASPNNTEQNN